MICCVLSFKNRHHPVWQRGYTALFFLDEATALAAGHRPLFRMPARGREALRRKMGAGEELRNSHAPDMDLVLQAERLDGRAKRTHDMAIGDLPDGVLVTLNGAAGSCLRDPRLASVALSENGYVEKIAHPAAR